MDYRDEAPEILKDFLQYHEVVKGHSQATIDEYYLDLRTFFRFLKQRRGLVPKGTDFAEIPIGDVDLPMLAAVTKSEVYDFLSFLSRDRVRQQRSLMTGEIGIFLYDGNAYLKQLVARDGQVALHSLNPRYDDILISDVLPLRVLGKVLTA